MGECPEIFNNDTRTIHGLNSKSKLPFKDKEFDFVICLHTLGDMRGSLLLYSEIIRIEKVGYIEVLSIEEDIYGLENRNYAGYSYHRWLIEIKDSEIFFRFKTYTLNSSWEYHLPYSYQKKNSIRR